MIDVFRFLALAVAVGLAAGMVLGGMALLLAAPAHAAAAAHIVEAAPWNPACR